MIYDTNEYVMIKTHDTTALELKLFYALKCLGCCQYSNYNPPIPTLPPPLPAGPDGDAELVPSDKKPNMLFGTSVCISTTGNIAIVGATGDEDDKGSAYIFYYDGAKWTETFKLLASDGNKGDQFGSSVAVSDDGITAIVGARYHNAQVGAAYIYTKVGNNWAQQSKLILPTDILDRSCFGGSVSISKNGNTVVVGNDTHIVNRNATAYVYTRTGTSWSSPQTLSPNANGPVSVHINDDGNVVVIGAYRNKNKGSVYVFKKISNVWTQTDIINPNDLLDNDEFGISVGVANDGNVIVIGANGTNNDIGATYVYTKINNTYIKTNINEPDISSGKNYLGTSVSISGNGKRILSGASSNNITGSVFVYDNTNTWIKNKKLVPNDSSKSSRFGWSTYIANNSKIAIVGDDKALDENGDMVGKAHIFLLDDQVTPTPTPTPTPTQNQIPDLNNKTKDWKFGEKVVIGRTSLIAAVSATGYDSNKGGVFILKYNTSERWEATHFLQPDDAIAKDYFGYKIAISGDGDTIAASSKNMSGCVYVFYKNGNEYYQQSKIVISSLRNFGESISISNDGNTLIIGNVTNASKEVGTVYIYTRTGSTWKQLRKITQKYTHVDSNLYGYSLDISGDGKRLVISEQANSDNVNQSEVWINNNGWNPHYYPLKETPHNGGIFGFDTTTCANGDTIAISNMHSDHPISGVPTGSVNIYQLDQSWTWTQVARVYPTTNSITNLFFGWSIDLSNDGDILVIGAKGGGKFGKYSGEIHIYEHYTNGWGRNGQPLTAPNGKAYDYFGTSVAISGIGGKVIVGTESGTIHAFSRTEHGSWKYDHSI